MISLTPGLTVLWYVNALMIIKALLVSFCDYISWKFRSNNLSNYYHSFFTRGSSFCMDSSLYREFKRTTKVFLLIVSGELF